MTVYSNSDTIALINQYVRFALYDGYRELENLRCTAGFQRYTYDDGTYGQVKECWVKFKGSNEQRVQFLFKDLNATNDTEANAGQAGMTCIAEGGQFDGSSCSAIGPSQCMALADKLPGGTHWDKTLGICVSNDAQRLQNYQKDKLVVETAAGIVIGVLFTVATGGAGAGFVIAWVATTANSLATVAGLVLNEIKNERVRDFVIAANNFCPYARTCKGDVCTFNCPENSTCAKNTLVGAYGDIKNMLYSEDDQISKAVTQAHDKLLEKISPQCVDETFVERLHNAVSGLGIAIAIVKGVEVVSAVAGAHSDAIGTVGRAVQTGTRVGKTMKMIIKNNTSLKTMEQILNVGNKAYSWSSVL